MLKNWKIWVPTVLVLGALLWWTAVGLKKQVLIRSDGEVLVADQIWVVDRKVYYIRGVKMAWVEYTPGQRIIQGSFIEPSSYAPLLTVHFRNSLEKYTGIALPDTLFHQPLTGFFQKGLRFGARNAGYFALAILLFFCVKHGRRFFNKKIRRTGDTDALRSGYHPPLAGIADVEALFLELFREKIGAPFEAPSEIVVLTNYVPDR